MNWGRKTAVRGGLFTQVFELTRAIRCPSQESSDNKKNDSLDLGPAQLHRLHRPPRDRCSLVTGALRQPARPGRPLRRRTRPQYKHSPRELHRQCDHAQRRVRALRSAPAPARRPGHSGSRRLANPRPLPGRCSGRHVSPAQWRRHHSRRRRTAERKCSKQSDRRKNWPNNLHTRWSR